MLKSFEDLKGIGKEKEKVRTSDSIELLTEIFREYSNINNFNAYSLYGSNDKYLEILEFTRDRISEGMMITPENLTKFILTFSNADFDKDIRMILGLYTGSLLQLLTEKNVLEGKRTQFFLDGRNLRFDYLFYRTKKIDELFISNLKGDNICKEIACGSGTANSLFLDNIEGNGTLENAANYKGDIKKVVLTNSKGSNSLSYMGSNEGHIGIIISKDNVGDNIGRGIGMMNGKVGYSIFDNNRGHAIGTWMGGQRGRLDTIIMKDIKGEMNYRGWDIHSIIGRGLVDRGCDKGYKRYWGDNVNSHVCDLEKLSKKYDYIKEIMKCVERIDGKNHLDTLDIIERMNIKV